MLHNYNRSVSSFPEQLQGLIRDLQRNHWIVRLRYEDHEVLQATWGLINTWAKDAKRASAQILFAGSMSRRKPGRENGADVHDCDDHAPTASSFGPRPHARHAAGGKRRCLARSVAEDGEALTDLLRSAPDNFLMRTLLSARANSVRNDDAECLALAETTGRLLTFKGEKRRPAPAAG
jgi:hypothetical protein